MQNQPPFLPSVRRQGSEALASAPAPQPRPWPGWSYQTATENTFSAQSRNHHFSLIYRPRFARPHVAHPANTPAMAAAVDQYNLHTPGVEQAGLGTDGFPFGPFSGSDFMDKSWAMGDAAMADNLGFDPASDPRYSMDLYQTRPRPTSLSPPGLTDSIVADHRVTQLQPIDTTIAHLRKWGDITPPDDDPSPGAKFPSPEHDSGVVVKEELTEPLQASPARRKRSSVGGPVEGSAKRRRTRKSILAASPDEDDIDEPVEDDKRNKFLERNRVAASKCRQKKKEWTVNLETRARELQASKASLATLAASLKEEVMWLKGEMLKHSECGCTHIREYLAREAQTIASGGTRGSSSPIGRARLSPADENVADSFPIDWPQNPEDSVPGTQTGGLVLSQVGSRIIHRPSDHRLEGKGDFRTMDPR